MSLIGTLVNKLLSTGSITLHRPGKPPETFGKKGGRHLTVRFTDRKVAFDIVRNPRLGIGEAYMDGRVIIEDGTILDLLELIVGAERAHRDARVAQVGRDVHRGDRHARHARIAEAVANQLGQLALNLRVDAQRPGELAGHQAADCTVRRTSVRR